MIDSVEQRVSEGLSSNKLTFLLIMGHIFFVFMPSNFLLDTRH